MVDIIKYGKFHPKGKQKKKKQIILTHTSRNLNDYLAMLNNRYNGNYRRIPNYLITQDGKVLQLLNNNEYSNYFNDLNIDKNSIIVCLENLGWLEKEPLTGHYINWIGDIYKGNTIDKKWRDYYFWHPYSDKQMESLSTLCKSIIKETSIKKQVIGHNTKTSGVEKYEGIVTKSNFSTRYTDVSPAFNFENFTKQIENE
jgi:N-acetyl-anhydromuramyl-L-alanine amidase AmpD